MSPKGSTSAATDEGVVTFAGSGFVTRAIVDDSLSPFLSPGSIPTRALIDLRDVSGYEDSCVERAREWLIRARREGTERIAFVANSAVIRTVTEMASQGIGVPLRTFATPTAAREWLCSTTTPIVLERHRPRTRVRS